MRIMRREFVPDTAGPGLNLGRGLRRQGRPLHTGPGSSGDPAAVPHAAGVGVDGGRTAPWASLIFIGTARPPPAPTPSSGSVSRITPPPRRSRNADLRPRPRSAGGSTSTTRARPSGTPRSVRPGATPHQRRRRGWATRSRAIPSGSARRPRRVRRSRRGAVRRRDHRGPAQRSEAAGRRRDRGAPREAAMAETARGSILGTCVRRVEDLELITGASTFIGNLAVDGLPTPCSSAPAGPRPGGVLASTPLRRGRCRAWWRYHGCDSPSRPPLPPLHGAGPGWPDRWRSTVQVRSGWCGGGGRR
ncbi:hypothetical protein HBB16_09785 [Pseudonocardia sp. MCCB 268]|nr:hypothetical protein [Pseudonocardia cytotoxica]